jgi:quercetin dioxygenase-like cupin family protein
MELEREKLDICQFPPFDNGTQIDFAIFEANTLHPPHVHEEGSAILYVIDGEGKIILGDKETDYLPGNIFNVPKGTRHGFSAKKETVLLSIQDKPILFKDKLDLMYDDSS